MRRPLRTPPCIVKPHIIPALGDAGPRNRGFGTPGPVKKQSNRGVVPDKSAIADVVSTNLSKPRTSGPSAPSEIQIKKDGLSSENVKRALMQNDVSEDDKFVDGSEVISLDCFERMERAAVSGAQSALESPRSSVSKASAQRVSSPGQSRFRNSRLIIKKEKNIEAIDDRCRASAGIATDSVRSDSRGAGGSRTRSDSRGAGGSASLLKQKGLGGENIKELFAVKEKDFGQCGKNGVGPANRGVLRPQDQNLCIEDAHHRRGLHHHRMEFGPPPRGSDQVRTKAKEVALPNGRFVMY